MRNHDQTNRLLTKQDVASLFQVSPRTVSRWQSKGLLNPVRINERIVRYPAEQVQALIEEASHG